MDVAVTLCTVSIVDIDIIFILLVNPYHGLAVSIVNLLTQFEQTDRPVVVCTDRSCFTCNDGLQEELRLTNTSSTNLLLTCFSLVSSVGCQFNRSAGLPCLHKYIYLEQEILFRATNYMFCVCFYFVFTFLKFI